MARHETRSYQKNSDFIYPVNAAQKFISLFEQVVKPNEEQRAMLAAAYYTLATQQNISLNRSRMHVNSAISLLREINITERKENWGSQIAHAYFKRAELQEEKSAYKLATVDYKHAIDTLEHYEKTNLIDDYDRLLFAQSAISIADLIVNEQIQAKDNDLEHPLFYINKALEQLAEITQLDDDIWTTQAYAHQIAGIALSTNHFEEAKEAFHTAIAVAFNTESLCISPLLADIYTCLGLLYEQRYQNFPIHNASFDLIDHAMVYFGLALLFSPNDVDEEREDDILIMESLFEMIYRVLDPFLIPLSKQVGYDLIDALIYAYLCVLEKILPNRALASQLSHPDTLDTFAQHIYWLVLEAYRKDNFDAELLEIANPTNPHYKLSWRDISKILDTNVPDNVYYLKTKKSNHLEKVDCTQDEVDPDV